MFWLDNPSGFAHNTIIVKDRELLKLIEDVIRDRLSVRLEYDDLRRAELNTTGGSFVFRNQRYIVVHKHLPVREKIAVLTEILADMNIDCSTLPDEVARRVAGTLQANPEKKIN